jgi:hypothetical protein
VQIRTAKYRLYTDSHLPRDFSAECFHPKMFSATSKFTQSLGVGECVMLVDKTPNLLMTL